MKRVYLTEEQYIGFVLNECLHHGILNESILNEGKILSTLFKGCKTFGDYARRIIYIASAGIVINVAIFRDVINNLPVGTPEQKQELLTQVENKLENDTPEDTTQYAQSFTISQDGIEHIKDYEKCHLEPYYATESERKRGIRTIGWGHKITRNDPEWLIKATSITQEQADALFANDIKVFENELLRAVRGLTNKQLKNPEIYPQQFIDVVISMLYNSGLSNVKASDFYKTWNNCRIDPKTGKIRIDDYNYTISKIPNSCVTQKGSVMRGLVNRRNTEHSIANVYKQ